MDILFEQLVQHTVQQIRQLAPQLDERAARRLLEAHLDPAHFAMPIHDLAVEKRLIAWSQGDEDLPSATEFLRFEETRTIRGIARVMARTHTNRQGVADVTRAARWRVQSPRVVGVFELAQDDAALHRWTEYTPMLEAFLKLANRNRASTTDAAAYFESDDIQNLEALARLTPEQARELGARDVPGCNKKPGWARVVLGLYTGLRYLDERFGFDASRVWSALEAAQRATEVDALARDARRQVTEFGAALSHSFFADLGCASFVKADVHVTDVVSAALKLNGKPAPQLCIDFVRQMAEETGRTPRAIDKLLYFACSGKLYLAGLAPAKAVADAAKAQLLTHLRQRGSEVRRPSAPSETLSLGDLSLLTPDFQ